MISNILIVLACVCVTLALRSFQHPLLRRAGAAGVVATSFVAGWLILGHWVYGVFCAVSWFFLPWLEILTRVRALRMPIERIIQPKTPPPRNAFPNLQELTDEIEEQGFEHACDVGWDFEGYGQFLRVFCEPKLRAQAAISLAEQDGIVFYYLSITSRTSDGWTYTTWNYPFSYGLRIAPRVILRRIEPGASFAEMLSEHASALEGVSRESLLDLDVGAVKGLLQAEMHAQIAHNLKLGLLKREGKEHFRYSIRGMFFLWLQFLRDLVRMS